MYNKLFGGILDSSIWNESEPTRIVWITILAAKDQDHIAHFAAIENLARRANVTVEHAEQAIKILEAPDKTSSDPDHEGRRIERVPGGWFVLNGEKYSAIYSAEIKRKQTRERVATHRAKGVTPGGVTDALQTVSACTVEDIYKEYPRAVAPREAKRAIQNALNRTKIKPEELLERTRQYAKLVSGAERTLIPYPATWFNQDRFNCDPIDWAQPLGPAGKSAIKKIVSRPKDNRDIPDEMKSWLIEQGIWDRDNCTWKVLGDIPPAYRGAYWAAVQKRKSQ